MPFRSLAFSFRMAHTTIRKIVYEVCQAIWEEMNQEHMPYPTVERHLSIANDFFLKWNFPNCIGCIDGEHIRIRCPPNSGSMFWNYKHFYSIVLQAVSDANGRFLYIDVGSYGKQSDGGIFSASSLMYHLENASFNVPHKRKIPGTDVLAPLVLLGDEAYPLKVYLMRPYSGRGLDEQREVYNYRLSRARRIVECAFGILCAKWRILKKEIEYHPDKAEIIVKTTCLLHNIIIAREGFSSEINIQRNTPATEINNLPSFKKKQPFYRCSLQYTGNIQKLFQ
ncbi:unnamed protein product [Acanthoscelides obtectus]|uniref:DDE Tnp4 domain-containing protein n=1 Tax=Acanthoscelides obtectus TaxID=200917 RepID=A0A9P0LLW3_ACAOB|nr:unnamed protein product [Acanthoscelides obtectus]CAK1624386.1 Protein ANTAGONIST OF LIKE HETEROCHROMATIN PROTEIN 1 [Acanthoscelides obtectus]